MKELRDIKIDILTGSQNPVIELFNQITDGTEIINCDVYETHGLEFIYHKDGEWIFYQDCKNKNFWCSHTKYWSHFESSLQLDYGEIQAITKYLVEEALKREVSPPILFYYSPIQQVEEALKREVSAPPQWHKNLPQVVEEALKREVVRAQVGPQSVYPGGILEEALKREVSTPVIAPRINAAGLEETLKREVASPVFVTSFLHEELEETLKREVASPTRKMMKYSVHVEETLKRELTPDNENPVET